MEKKLKRESQLRMDL